MLLQLSTKGTFETFPPKVTDLPPKERAVYTYLKEDKLKNGLQKEATVLGTIQILCCLMSSSLGAILVSTSYSSHFDPEFFTTLMTGYPFVGALCFAVSGLLSIISGKISAKPFAMSSLTSSAVSSAVAGAGFFFLACTLVALGTTPRNCSSEKEDLSSLPYLEYYYSIYEDKDCLRAGVSITGILVVMLVFTVLEILLAVYSFIFWWEQVYSNSPKSAFFLHQSQDHAQHVKKSSPKSWI
ncbi:membrane-spanning 4-domains subfamily A member 7 isoform X1 [Castor canadensis]|uniref:Membrane-spanning 4-domains subfamily A member 7 n=2 Tax=Castor canadensis TaxID=51338 RepID=A0A8B7TTJ1_CASCN|nr:membrane-spanning 4-domains subfamily A member 7 [Castor canadensis]